MRPQSPTFLNACGDLARNWEYCHLHYEGPPLACCLRLLIPPVSLCERFDSLKTIALEPPATEDEAEGLRALAA